MTERPIEDGPATGRFIIHEVLGLSDDDADKISEKLHACYESEETMPEVLAAASKGRSASDVMMGYNIATLFNANDEAVL